MKKDLEGSAEGRLCLQYKAEVHIGYTLRTGTRRLYQTFGAKAGSTRAAMPVRGRSVWRVRHSEDLLLLVSRCQSPGHAADWLQVLRRTLQRGSAECHLRDTVRELREGEVEKLRSPSHFGSR